VCRNPLREMWVAVKWPRVSEFGIALAMMQSDLARGPLSRRRWRAAKGGTRLVWRSVPSPKSTPTPGAKALGLPPGLQAFQIDAAPPFGCATFRRPAGGSWGGPPRTAGGLAASGLSFLVNATPPEPRYELNREPGGCQKPKAAQSSTSAVL